MSIFSSAPIKVAEVPAFTYGVREGGEEWGWGGGGGGVVVFAKMIDFQLASLMANGNFTCVPQQQP